MKKYLISFMLIIPTLFFLAPAGYSQGLAINTDGSTADPSAMLDIKATDKGMLVPRVTSASVVTAPVAGLLVYQISAPAGFYYYDGAAWLLLQNSNHIISSSNGGAGSINGILKADGSGTVSAATAGTDYLIPGGSAADLTGFPVLNQNTTGSAATLTTARTINGVAFDGSGDIILPASPTGDAGGSLAGSYPNPTIAADGISTTEILDGTITNLDISATAAIPYSKLALTNTVQNGDIVANAITTSKVANGTVTTSKMADSAISGLKLLTGAVTPKHISITGASAGQAMIFDGTSVAWAMPAGGGVPTGEAGGGLAGNYPNPTIAANGISTTEILDGTITGTDISATAAIPYSKLTLTNSLQNVDITANAITTSKVANGTVTTSKMADSAISGLKLLTGAVTPKHISITGASAGQAMIFDGTSVAWAMPAGGGVPTGEAGGGLAGSYPNPTIATGGVSTNEILDGTITNFDISATAAIPYSKLALTNTVQNGDIVANAITTSKVANGTVTTSKMADSAISGLKLLTGAVTPKHISSTGATAGQAIIFNGTSVSWATPAGGGAPTGEAGGSLAGSYPNPTIATGGVSTNEILDGTITGTDISATAAIPYSKLTLSNSVQNGDIVINAITTSKVAAGTVTMSKMADSAISGLKLLTYAVSPRHISPVGASAGQAMIFNGATVGWATLGGGAPTGLAGGSLMGTYPDPTLGAGTVTATEILDNTITGADISTTAAIPYSKLTLNNAVQNTDIVANAITTSKVANGTVTNSKMADSSINGLKLLTYAVFPRHINTVGASAGQSMIFDGAIVKWGTPAGISSNYGTPLLKSSNYAIATTDLFIYTITDGLTFTLPSASSAGAGKVLYIMSGSLNGVNVLPASGNSMVLPGSSNITASTNFYQAVLVSDGASKWICISEIGFGG